jgi:hypothetical protein
MIDKNCTYRTRDGREVRIYATDGEADQAVHGAFKKDGLWICCAWQSDGSYYNFTGKSNLDLIEVRPRHKRTVWVNVYNENYGAFSTKEGADAWKALPRLACIKVELDFAEGDGL